MNFVTKALDAGGSLHPLVFPTGGTGLFNPSIYKDGDDLLVNIRHSQYTIYHAEKGKFEHQWGPLCYLCPEDDMTLTTVNYIGRIDPVTLELTAVNKVDTSLLDVKPIWEFVGLEDARLVRWGGRLYMYGVRRDTTTNGTGRMEQSEIADLNREITRWRIPAPGDDNVYCEKNWMPVIDMPWHFIKWTNPTEVVKIDPVAKTCVTVYQSQKYVPFPYDWRGGSHCIPYGKDGGHIAICHLVIFFSSKATEAGRKNAQYRHAFVVWDKDWNVVKFSEIFSFMDGEIEFCCGMVEHNGKYLITFGFQDNAAYLVEVPKKVIEEYVNE
jgi:hypothetical protein